MAVHAFFALDSYIYGFAVQQQNLPSGTPEELAGMAETMLVALPAAEYPYLREVIAEYVLKAGFDYTKEFEFGLDLLLDALENVRDAPEPPPASAWRASRDGEYAACYPTRNTRWSAPPGRPGWSTGR